MKFLKVKREILVIDLLYVTLYVTIFSVFLFTNLKYLSKEKDCNLDVLMPLITNHIFFISSNSIYQIFFLQYCNCVFRYWTNKAQCEFITFDICNLKKNHMHNMAELTSMYPFPVLHHKEKIALHQK